MIDHLTVSVADLAASRAFFTAVLKPLGYGPLREWPGLVGFGDTRPYLWIKQAAQSTTPQHLAFVARDRAHVDAFHAAAMQAGARDDGAPGVRKDYHPNYYAAFIIDPLNGHPIEAVWHLPIKAAAAKPSKKKAPVKAKAKSKKAAKKTRK